MTAILRGPRAGWLEALRIESRMQQIPLHVSGRRTAPSIVHVYFSE